MFEMGIIKVEVNFPELKEAILEIEEGRKKFFDLLHHEIKHAAGSAIDQVMNSEIALFLGKPSEIGNKRNGYEQRNYAIKGIGGITVNVPRDRKGRFESAIIPKSEKIDPRLKEDMAVLHLAGISTRDLELMSKRILGLDCLDKQSVTLLKSSKKRP